MVSGKIPAIKKKKIPLNPTIIPNELKNGNQAIAGIDLKASTTESIC